MDEFSSLVEGFDFDQYRYSITRLLFEDLKHRLEMDISKLHRWFNIRLYGSGLFDVMIGEFIEGDLACYVFFRTDYTDKVRRILKLGALLAENHQVSSITFVSKEEAEDLPRAPLVTQATEERETRHVHVDYQWSRDFNDLAHRREFLNIIGDPPSKKEMRVWLAGIRNKHLKQIHHELDEKWRERRHRDSEVELQYYFKEKDIILFLGTGVSRDAGGPTWYELMQNLRISMYESLPKTQRLHVLTRTRMCDALSSRFDPLVDAEQLWYGFESIESVDFIEKIRQFLYAGVPDILPHNDKGRILSCIARVCRPRGRGIKAIVTYNWDDLLERQLSSKRVDYKIITNDKDKYGFRQLPIYHVHGFLPKEWDPYPDILVDVPLIFKEREYHDLYRNPYHWSNHVQLNFLRDHTCVFIGLSMNDPNLRRLLRIAAEKHDDAKHYTHFKWNNTSDLIRQSIPSSVGNQSTRARIISSIIASFNATDAETIVRVQQDLIDQDLMSLRVKTVWGRHHPCVNRLLMNAGGTMRGYGECQFSESCS